MRVRIGAALTVATAVVALAAGMFALGSATASSDSARQAGYRSGHSAGYFEGLAAGEAQGREDGRALQEGQSLPPNSRQPVHDAFTAGYAAGNADAFAGYDGGWAISSPYAITLARGNGSVTYRITSRTLLKPHVNYYLCANGHDLCSQPRN